VGTTDAACGQSGNPCIDCTAIASEHGPLVCGDAKTCESACACGDGVCNNDVTCNESPSSCSLDCADCTDLVDAISQKTSGAGVTCSSVVRLDYETSAILGYAIFCGPYTSVDEGTARATAQADTGFGQSGWFLSGPTPEDEYVFEQPAGDFGGASAVSALSGLTVFGGSIVWGGAGAITYPSSWGPAQDLGSRCPAPAPAPPARGFNLDSGNALSMAEVDSALAVVWQTALAGGLWKNAYVFDAVVLLYPPSVGAFDPTTAEWVVIVNSGWLE
jgi:hypothetical protein